MKATDNTTAIHIAPPNIKVGELWIKGTAPLVVKKFDTKTGDGIAEQQKAGSTAKSKKKREARDFEAEFQAARHISFDGWDGIHASAFRNASIDACRLVGFKMTLAKLSIFIEADGFDRETGDPLVRIIGGEPRQFVSPVRNPSTGGTSLASRPQWIEWGAKLRFRYDADQFTANDVVNLIARAGAQVGVGEGRPSSHNSFGMGWGLFEISDEKSVRALESKGGAK